MQQFMAKKKDTFDSLFSKHQKTTNTVLNHTIKCLLILLLIAGMHSCEEEFRPELSKYEGLLVVDGLLTNGEDPVSVKLSVASTVYEKALIPLSGAELHISDQDGEVIMLAEKEPGTYKAADSLFTGVSGNSYQLHIALPDGRRYVSDPCMLRPSIPIDAVYGEEENPELGETDHELPGVQFYVENHANTSDTLYYLWRLIHTWQYRSSFNIDYTWEGELIPFPNPDSLRTCWITKNVGKIIFGSTLYLDPTDINRFPLHFVPTNTKLLSIRYSLMVKQLNISGEAWEFYYAIEQQNIEQGDLWSEQPVQIRGNVMRLDEDVDEPVLGYFIVAGETKKRIFIDRPDLPFSYTECVPDYDLRWLPFTPPSSWPIYLDDIMFTGLAAGDQDACFDCRLRGGDIEPPGFWTEQGE